MVEGVVSRAFIMSNGFATSQATVNISRSKVLTIQNIENITETKYIPQTDQSLFPQAGPQSFQYSLIESAITVGAGTIVRQKAAVRTISEPAKTISETLTKKAIHLIAEPAKTISDSLTKSKKVTRAISEPSSAVGDSLLKQAAKIRTISEPAKTISDSLAITRVFNRTLTPETTTISSSLANVAHKVRQIIEAPTTLTETLRHLHADTLDESPIPITEQLAVSRILSRTLSDFSFTTPTSFTTASFMYTIPITERLRKTVNHQLSHVTTITENLSKLRIASRILSEVVSLQPEVLSRLVIHRLTENIALTESLLKTKIVKRILSETANITESLASARTFRRSINPQSFTDESFTTGAFESFKILSEDAVEITEQLEAFVLPYWQKVIYEPVVNITEQLLVSATKVRTISESPITIGESLIAQKILYTPSTGGRGGKRRRRLAPPYLFPRRPEPVIEEPIPVREPQTFVANIFEPPTAISDSLTVVKIIKQVERIPTPIISAVASIPEKEIVEVEKIIVIEKEIQPPPIIQPQPILVSKPRPIETEQEILVSTQTHSNKMKSRAASAKLQIIQEIMELSEMEQLL